MAASVAGVTVGVGFGDNALVTEAFIAILAEPFLQSVYKKRMNPDRIIRGSLGLTGFMVRDYEWVLDNEFKRKLREIITNLHKN